MSNDDRTSSAKLRDAAIALVGSDGLDGLTARRVAAAAGVSPGLIRHHFGSMEGLRRACDQHVADVIRRDKEQEIASPSLDPLKALRSADSTHLVAYLAAVLTEDSPIVSDLVDLLVTDAEAYIKTAEAHGHVRPCEDPRRRATVLLLWSLGSLVLHRHAHRLLGVDLTDIAGSDPDALGAYAATSTDLLGRGLYMPAFADQLMDALTKDVS